MDIIIEKIIKSYYSLLDEVLLIGLNLKGYSFNSEGELKDFIIKNCTRIDEQFEATNTYYVCGEPFLKYYFKDITDFKYEYV